MMIQAHINRPLAKVISKVNEPKMEVPSPGRMRKIVSQEGEVFFKESPHPLAALPPHP